MMNLMRRPDLRSSWHALLVLVVCCLCAAPAAAQRTHVLIVSGISGEPRFAAQWNGWAQSLAGGLERAGVQSSDIVRLGERAGGEVVARSTKDEIGSQLLRIGGAAGADDQVLLVFFAHGSESGGEARINLPGPDLTAGELAAMLASLTARVIVVNAASASGGFVGPLAGGNRVVITATRSAAQNNETVFGEHFAAAFDGGGADTDKDGRVSLLEAFEYARLEVERAYASTNRMRTEHALLDADGDGEAVGEPGTDTSDALAAAGIFFGTGGVAAVTAQTAPAGARDALRALYEKRTALQSQIDALRARREQMEQADYERELEALLVELATTSQAIRTMEGGSR